jgi:2-polyprenyl-3-methyl-5-hydroxy-6-metoxy-1,4-benzoquinol methylase
LTRIQVRVNTGQEKEVITNQASDPSHKHPDRREIEAMATNEEKHRVGAKEHPKNSINLNPVRRFFEQTIDHPKEHLQPYVAEGQVVADLGCEAGYYTLALAESVGPEGRVYAVDLEEERIRALEKQIEEGGYQNIEARASSAGDLAFIQDGSVDFVLANGLL